MDARSRVIKVEVCSDDKPALGAVSRMFAELAGETTVGVLAEFHTHLHEPEQPGALVDTAAVFSQAPAALPTPPDASVAPPAPAPAAPAPPTPPAPPAPPTPPATGAVELDKNNLPWDARINTSNKAKTTKGVWKMSKGLAEGVYDAVVAELKQVMALSAGQPAAPAAPTPPTPPTPPAPAVAGVPGMTHSYTTPGVGGTFTTAPGEPVPAGGVWVSTQPMPQPAAPTPPTPPVPPTPAPGAEEAPTTYAQLLQHITKHMSAQKITSDEINLVCAQNGLPSLNMAANAQHLVPSIFAGCAAIWNSRP